MKVNKYRDNFRKDLYESTVSGNLGKVKTLLKKGYGINYFRDNLTPLMVACKHSKPISFALISFGADLDMVNQRGKTALFYACEKGDFDIVKKLYEMNAFNVLEDSNKKHILHYAINSNSESLVNFLFSLNYDLNVKDVEGKTPLHYATKKGNANMIELFIKNGANVNILDNSNSSPIFYATDLKTIKVLIDYGSNIFSNEKTTLIHNLIINKKSKEIEYLHERLGKCKFENILGPNSCNPLLYSVFNDDHLLTKYLIESGHSPNTSNAMEITPLMRAVDKKNSHNVKLLIENGADISAVNKKGETAFTIACKHNNLKAIKLLHSKGVDVNQQCKSGYTPLMWAVMYKYNEVCDYLIEKGANPLIENVYGKNSITLAEESMNDYFLNNYNL